MFFLHSPPFQVQLFWSITSTRFLPFLSFEYTHMAKVQSVVDGSILQPTFLEKFKQRGLLIKHSISGPLSLSKVAWCAAFSEPAFSLFSCYFKLHSLFSCYFKLHSLLLKLLTFLPTLILPITTSTWSWYLFSWGRGGGKNLWWWYRNALDFPLGNFTYIVFTHFLPLFQFFWKQSSVSFPWKNISTSALITIYSTPAFRDHYSKPPISIFILIT